MRVCVIVPSIRKFQLWPKYARDFKLFDYDPDILIIDEEPSEVREANRELLGSNAEFFGEDERRSWFKQHKLTDKVIPIRSHAETSFGLLVAYEREYDVTCFLDDDTSPFTPNWLGCHLSMLGYESQRKVTKTILLSNTKWVPPLPDYYTRGFPYSERAKPTRFKSEELAGEVVLNQGLWSKIPDKNAVDILVELGLDGRPPPVWPDIRFNRIVDRGCYTTVCSMNLSFKTEIVPAFYQLPMERTKLGDGRISGVDRFDDIWSGVFLKKVLDKLGKSMSFGLPLCVHDKTPRDVFRDIQAEMDGVLINEQLWKVVDEIQLDESTDYYSCYAELASKLRKESSHFHIPYLIESMCRKMLWWTELVAKLE